MFHYGQARAMLFAPILLAAAAMAFGASAPPAFDPPIHAKHLDADPLGAAITGQCLDAIAFVHWFDDFAGQNKALEAASRESGHKLLEIGRLLPIALDAASLFDAPPLLVDGLFHHTAAIGSQDAFQLALEVDMLAWRPGDELFVVDPQVQRAFGPIVEARTEDGFAWLPMTGGDTAVLVVRSVYDTPPPLMVTALSHGYIDLARELANDAGPKAAPCNNHIACETDADLQFLSSGIGRYTFNRGGGTSMCSGSLINVPGTAALEPYFLTANHCVSTEAHAQTMQVWWDYRAASCDGGGVPSLGSLPTSFGIGMLAASSPYDHALTELDHVPSGSFGRAYLGWDTEPPVLEDELIGIHHPRGSAMRISYGNVTVVSVSSSTYPSHVRVEWYDGVTEGGSSGSPLLLPGRDNAVIGVLHAGAVHVCPEDPERNWDVYGPFRLFFPQVEAILTASDGGNGAQPAVPRLQAPAEWGISGSSVTMTVNRVRNEGNGTSGALRLRLFASETVYAGPQTNGFVLGTATLGSLAGQASLGEVSRTVVYNPPPHGDYRTALLLEEHRGVQAGFVVVDYLTFPNTVTLGVPPALAPPAHDAGFKLLHAQIREPVFPAAPANGSIAAVAPGEAAALRVTSHEPFAPDSLHASIAWDGHHEPAEVRWHWIPGGGTRDAWALVRLPDALPEGAIVTVSVNASSWQGAVTRASSEFRIDPGAPDRSGPPRIMEAPDLPALPAYLGEPVSPVYRIGPEGVYDAPATVRVPVPGGVRPEEAVLHYHSTAPGLAGWYRAPEVIGWLASDVRVVTDSGGQYLEFAVHHGGSVQLGRPGMIQFAGIGGNTIEAGGSPHHWGILAAGMLAFIAIGRPRRQTRPVPHR